MNKNFARCREFAFCLVGNVFESPGMWKTVTHNSVAFSLCYSG